VSIKKQKVFMHKMGLVLFTFFPCFRHLKMFPSNAWWRRNKATESLLSNKGIKLMVFFIFFNFFVWVASEGERERESVCEYDNFLLPFVFFCFFSHTENFLEIEKSFNKEKHDGSATVLPRIKLVISSASSSSFSFFFVLAQFICRP